jgi:hypothetical protein
MNKASRWLGSLVGGSLFMARRLFISVAILLLLPSRVWACACCAHPGEYQINFVKPDAYKLSVMERMRFGTTAYLFTGEAEPDDAAKGLAHPADTYSLSGSLVGNVWKLTSATGMNPAHSIYRCQPRC